MKLHILLYTRTSNLRRLNQKKILICTTTLVSAMKMFTLTIPQLQNQLKKVVCIMKQDSAMRMFTPMILHHKMMKVICIMKQVSVMRMFTQMKLQLQNQLKILICTTTQDSAMKTFILMIPQLQNQNQNKLLKVICTMKQDLAMKMFTQMKLQQLMHLQKLRKQHMKNLLRLELQVRSSTTQLMQLRL